MSLFARYLPVAIHDLPYPLHMGALNELLQIGDCMERLEASPDTLDAAICVIAGADYLSGRAVGPRDEQLAFREGWIWAAAGESTG